jgi:hypothetical protein
MFEPMPHVGRAVEVNLVPVTPAHPAHGVLSTLQPGDLE